MTDERDSRSRRDVEVDPVQHLLAQLAATEPVREVHVLEANVPGDVRERLRARPVEDLGRLVEHAHDLVQRSSRGKERVVELRELLNRVEEVVHVEHEREQRPE